MKSYRQFCALARSLDHIGQRWTLLIVRELLPGPKRFMQLRSALAGVPPNLLAQRLRDLQSDGLITVKQLSPPANCAVYDLTGAGKELREVVESLIRWGGRWMLSGNKSDDFRSEWLAVSLNALGVGRRIRRKLIVRVGAPDDLALLQIAADGVILAPPTERPDLVVQGDPRVILGLAAGAMPLQSAASLLRLTPAGETGRRLLGQAFAVARQK